MVNVACSHLKMENIDRSAHANPKFHHLKTEEIKPLPYSVPTLTSAANVNPEEIFEGRKRGVIYV